MSIFIGIAILFPIPSETAGRTGNPAGPLNPVTDPTDVRLDCAHVDEDDDDDDDGVDEDDDGKGNVS